MVEKEQIEVENGFRRLATAAAFAGLFAYAVVMTVIPASINEIGRFYHAKPSLLGWLFRVMAIGFFAAILVGGRYSDKRGKALVLLVGCAFMSVGAYLFALASNFGIALAAIALLGIGGGFSEGIAMAIVSDLYGERRRTAMLNWAQMVFALGAIAAPLAVARLIGAGMRWQLGFVGTAVICAAAGLTTLAVVVANGEKPLSAHVEDLGWREIAQDRLVLWLSLGILLYVGAECGQANWLAAYFEGDIGSTAALAASSVAFFWIGISSGRAVAAWMSKRVSDFALICWALGLGAVCQTALLLMHSSMPALAATFILGFCLAPVWPTILSTAGAAHPRQSGTVFGIIIAAGALGGAIFPPSIGWLADSLGMRASLWICVVLLIANLGLFLRLRSRTQERP